MSSVGTKAPAFSLHQSQGDEVSLSDYLGRWVIVYFYPKDNTPGCTTESCDFRDQHQALMEAGAVVLGISPDGLSSHTKFQEKYHLPFPLLSDPDHVALTAYDVWKEKNMYGRKSMGVERSTFLIDPEGVIRHVWRKVKVAGHVTQVLETLQRLRG